MYCTGQAGKQQVMGRVTNAFPSFLSCKNLPSSSPITFYTNKRQTRSTQNHKHQTSNTPLLEHSRLSLLEISASILVLHYSVCISPHCYELHLSSYATTIKETVTIAIVKRKSRQLERWKEKRTRMTASTCLVKAAARCRTCSTLVQATQRNARNVSGCTKSVLQHQQQQHQQKRITGRARNNIHNSLSPLEQRQQRRMVSNHLAASTASHANTDSNDSAFPASKSLAALLAVLTVAAVATKEVSSSSTAASASIYYPPSPTITSHRFRANVKDTASSQSTNAEPPAETPTPTPVISISPPTAAGGAAREPRRYVAAQPQNVMLHRMRSVRGRGLHEKYKVDWQTVMGEGAYGSVHPARLAATGEKVRFI
jgi:hypothetical protein